MREQNKLSGFRVRGQFNHGATGDLLIGVAAMLGSVIWFWTVIVTALRPVGVPGAHRSTLDLHPTILVSFVLMGAAAIAMAAWKLKSKLAWAAVIVIWLGVLIFSVNVAFVIVTGDDAPVWPTHYLGIFVVALGSSILGTTLVRTRTMSVAVSLIFIAAVLVLPLSQMQDRRVLLWLPLGVAWLVVGLIHPPVRERTGGE